MKRVLIYGVTGSGKTTLAERLSQATGLPWHSVDELAWEPGWVTVADDEQRRRFAEICAGDTWILDTAYAKWLDVPLASVDTIVALDYPRWVSFGRLVRRTVARARDKKAICNGNFEDWRLVFSRESILIWHFRSFARKRARIRGWVAEGRNVVVLKSPRATDAFLAGLRR